MGIPAQDLTTELNRITSADVLVGQNVSANADGGLGAQFGLQTAAQAPANDSVGNTQTFDIKPS